MLHQLGRTGSSASNTLAYVPAIVFTLYDGYYIYTPTESTDSGTFEHTLKPYVYYTKEYTQGTNKLVINYSIDNYVAVYYYKSNGSEYTSKAGYLEIIDKNNGVYKVSNSEYSYMGISFTASDDSSAYNYYKEAYEFTTWFNDVISTSFGNYKDTLYIDNNNSALKGTTSSFNDEKTEVIKDTITNNLIQAMEMYSKNSGIDFEMPELTGDDWDTILNNICIIAFLQGLQVGTASFNDYVILPSTENVQYVDETSLYFIGSDGAYHRIGCTHLEGDTIVGYNKTEFGVQTSTDSNGNTIYSYLHDETACYYCMVQASDASIDSVENSSLSTNEKEKRYKAYYTALAREKYDLSKLSDYVNGSTTQYD